MPGNRFEELLVNQIGRDRLELIRQTAIIEELQQRLAEAEKPADPPQEETA